jgi:hypothetical protein
MGAKWKVSLEQKGMLPNVKGMMPALLGLSASMAHAEWVKIARSNLKTSKQEYIRGIQAPEIKGKVATLQLEGWLPNALESGLKAFDMKPGFLRSPNAKGAQGNKYFTVPFQLRSPGSAGGSATVMPKSIYSLVSGLKFGQSLNLPKKYEGYGLRSKLSNDMKKWGNYTWKTSPFQGVTKERRFPGESRSSPAGRMAQYKTFRRVSKKSDPGSWIHPGFRARDLLEKAVAKWEPQVSNMIAQALST